MIGSRAISGMLIPPRFQARPDGSGQIGSLAGLTAETSAKNLARLSLHRVSVFRSSLSLALVRSPNLRIISVAIPNDSVSGSVKRDRGLAAIARRHHVFEPGPPL